MVSDREKAAMNFMKTLMSATSKEDDKVDIFITDKFYHSNDYSEIAACSFSFGREGARRLLEINKAYADLQESISDFSEMYKMLPHTLSFDERSFSAFISIHEELGEFEGKIGDDNRYVQSEDELPENIRCENSSINIRGKNYIVFETWEKHSDNKIEIEINTELLQKIADGEFEEDNTRPTM